MDEILKKVKERLGITDNKRDNEIKGYIELFQNKIMSVCNRDDFPQKLNYMCIEFTRKSYIYYLNIDENSNKKVEVTSASDNGQSVGFKTTEIITADDIDIDNIINKNMAEISNYAYMRVVVMNISNEFKQVIADTFYDKNIEIWTSGTIKDDEGSIIGNGKLKKVDSFKGNFQFKTREYIQQEYGKEIQASAIVTCDNTVAKIGDILVYNGNDYTIVANPVSDSHTTLLVKGDD